MANNTNDLSTKLRQLREAKRLSMEELADLIKVSKSTYATWENNTEPKASDLKTLAQFYDMSVEELFGGISIEKEVLQRALTHSESSHYIKDKYINLLENEVQRLRGRQ